MTSESSLEKGGVGAPKLTKEEIEEQQLEKIKQQTLVFAEQHKGSIDELRNIFHTEDYDTFFGLPQGLSSLQSLYKSEVHPVNKDALPASILEIIATTEHIKRQEDRYKQLPREEGLYMPFEEKGGTQGSGDFWIKQEKVAGVGSVTTREEVPTHALEFLDMGGHNRDAQVAKVFVARLIELYHAKFAEVEKSERPSLFYILDQFLIGCPFLTPEADYTEVQITHTQEGGMVIEIEQAGVAPIFMRDRTTGVVTPLELPPNEGYATLGIGRIKETDSRTQRKKPEPVPNADVYVCSDGVFGIRLDLNVKKQMIEGTFRDTFAEFCRKREHLTPDEFKEQLFDYVEKAEREGRVDDDVTILVLEGSQTA